MSRVVSLIFAPSAALWLTGLGESLNKGLLLASGLLAVLLAPLCLLVFLCFGPELNSVLGRWLGPLFRLGGALTMTIFFCASLGKLVRSTMNR